MAGTRSHSNIIVVGTSEHNVETPFRCANFATSDRSCSFFGDWRQREHHRFFD